MKFKILFYSVAIGNFDGIHLGHRFILKHLKSIKNSSKDKIAKIMFHPHPIKVYSQVSGKNLIKFRTKYRLLEKIRS